MRRKLPKQFIGDRIHELILRDKYARCVEPLTQLVLNSRQFVLALSNPILLLPAA